METDWPFRQCINRFCPGSGEVLLQRTGQYGKEGHNFAQASQAGHVSSLFSSDPNTLRAWRMYLIPELRSGGPRLLRHPGDPGGEVLHVRVDAGPGGNCIKIGLPGKSILRHYYKRVGLPEDLFSHGVF